MTGSKTWGFNKIFERRGVGGENGRAGVDSELYFKLGIIKEELDNYNFLNKIILAWVLM